MTGQSDSPHQPTCRLFLIVPWVLLIVGVSGPILFLWERLFIEGQVGGFYWAFISRGALVGSCSLTTGIGILGLGFIGWNLWTRRCAHLPRNRRTGALVLTGIAATALLFTITREVFAGEMTHRGTLRVGGDTYHLAHWEPLWSRTDDYLFVACAGSGAFCRREAYVSAGPASQLTAGDALLILDRENERLVIEDDGAIIFTYPVDIEPTVEG
jgi:hypothetical protein